ncbi:MAG: hypothetical protein ACOY46_04035 [Bacillota bacterium]
MADKKDKKTKARPEGVDVSGYMPPGPVSPFPPVKPPYEPPVAPHPPGYCPSDHSHMDMKDTLACKLMKLMGQQVTVYLMGAGPAVQTGILHHVGMDYIELHVMTEAGMRVVYYPLNAISAITPGGPIVAEMPPQDVIPPLVEPL